MFVEEYSIRMEDLRTNWTFYAVLAKVQLPKTFCIFATNNTENQGMYIRGISAFYHDSAAAILRDGEIIAAAQEERFTRKKHDLAFPTNAVRLWMQECYNHFKIKLLFFTRRSPFSGRRRSLKSFKITLITV